jgi:type II secretory ATPase GspE/PulE/Tfp pilus assembly ATPase PilB-like protein
MQPWNRNWRLAAICIVASLFFLAGSAPVHAVSPEWSSGPANNVVQLLAQDWNDALLRGPGGYLSWIKLALVAVVFLIWVAMSDRLNQDALRFGEKTGLNAETWNTINVAGFVLGFFLAISIPIFWIGYPVYVLTAFVPPVLYFLMRRSKVKGDSTLANQIQTSKAIRVAAETGTVANIVQEALPQDEGAEVSFSTAGVDKQEKQTNLIRARQSHAFPMVKDMVADILTRRGDVVLMDFTTQAVGGRMQVDGSWHQLPTLDRETGDAMLTSYKFLAGLNPQDRRSKQKGRFGFKFNDFKGDIQVISQGTQTGERVQLKFIQKTKTELNLGQLGMWPEMFKSLVTHVNQPGLVVISGPPSQGLSTSWRAALMASDRVTRDCISFVEASNAEHDFENVTRHEYPDGQSPLEVMRKVMLTQPDALVVPDIRDAATLDELTSQVESGRTVITHMQSRSASEALLRLYALAGDKQRFAKAVTAATCQKLTRRLCETCKQQVQVTPKLIQQLGGDPRKQNWLCNPFTGPPPGAVDEKGEPIVIPPCKTCSGFGYIGRIAFFELIEVSDQLRGVMMKQPKVDTIAAAAQKLGNPSLAQQAYRLALAGLTSVNEIQRSLKS